MAKTEKSPQARGNWGPVTTKYGSLDGTLEQRGAFMEELAKCDQVWSLVNNHVPMSASR